MMLVDRRKVIEALLCAARPGGRARFTTGQVATIIGHGTAIATAAARAWLATNCDAWRFDHGTVCLEAAYRLIESSPVLRREWMGK